MTKDLYPTKMEQSGLLTVMTVLPALSNLKSLLSKPGDKFTAEITPTGKEVIKLVTSEVKRSAIRYPKTGTVVETIVYRVPKQ